MLKSPAIRFMSYGCNYLDCCLLRSSALARPSACVPRAGNRIKYSQGWTFYLQTPFLPSFYQDRLYLHEERSQVKISEIANLRAAACLDTCIIRSNRPSQISVHDLKGMRENGHSRRVRLEIADYCWCLKKTNRQEKRKKKKGERILRIQEQEKLTQSPCFPPSYKKS